MNQRADLLTDASLRRLHETEITDRTEIRSLLELIRNRVVTLEGTLNRQIRPETAQILELRDGSLDLKVNDPAFEDRAQLVLNATLDGSPYFFVLSILKRGAEGAVTATWPAVIYRTERRDRDRQPWSDMGWRVCVTSGGQDFEATAIEDYSGDGACLRVVSSPRLRLTDEVSVRVEQPGGEIRELFGVVRHRETDAESGELLGLALTEAPPGDPVLVETLEQALPLARRRRAARLAIAGGRHVAGRVLARTGVVRPRQPRIEFLDYENERGEPMRAIVDGWGDQRGATAVVIPPAFGKTKETLLPLAATIVATFRRARQPVTVVRFDATRRRGESYIEPSCRAPGDEFLRWSLAQSARDTLATSENLRRNPRFQPTRTILVTFSAAAVDGRRTLVLDDSGLFDGWVSVVGASDLQSALRTVSGGIDFVRAADHGVKLGRYEVQGILVDADFTVGDAVREGMAFLEDSRREMARIRIPITWIHGKYDAWMDLTRAQHVLAFGNEGNRRLVEIPTGHQLQNSREAFDTFQLVASEVARMALGRTIRPSLPDLARVDQQRRAERDRLPKQIFDARRFWHDYIVGRDGHFGSELMSATGSYRRLMMEQARALGLSPGDRVADVGCGAGALQRTLTCDGLLHDLRVDGFDFVHDALVRARERLNGEVPAGSAFSWVDADLTAGIPARAETYDAALASLVLSYVHDPERLLVELARVLRPGGRLVASSLRPDADTSRIYLEGVAELRAGGASRALGTGAEGSVDESARSFLNDAARLLTLEEEGRFRFWSAADLEHLAGKAGFADIRTTRAFGDPPQAIILSAKKP